MSWILDGAQSLVQSAVRRVGVAFARRGLPPGGTRRIEARGLREPVEVLRDAHGVPHVFARNARDLFFAQGFVQAEDRLFQMDLVRRVASGRLAEVLGDQPIGWREQSVRMRGYMLPELDFYLRILGLRRAAERSLAALGGEAQEAVLGFADGVNAFRERMTRKTMPIEFRILGYEPAPWEPADSVAVAKTMALQLDFTLRMKLFLAAARGKLGADPRLAELLPPEVSANDPRPVAVGHPPQHPPGSWPEKGTLGPRAQEFLGADGQFREFVGFAGSHLGSNWLLLGGSRTTTGKPLLVNDPHLELRTPSVFNLIHLSGGPYDVTGAALPAAPGIVLGHNRRVGWGFTNVMVDDTDLYQETINPLNPLQYRVGDAWRSFETITEEIRVKGETHPIRRTVRISRHGPILTDAFAAPPETLDRKRAPAGPTLDAGQAGPALAMRWTAHEATLELDALLGMNRAQSWPEMVEACRHFAAPGQNVAYADVDGHIGYYCTGRFPIRKNGKNLWPVDGASAATDDWKGMVPFEEQPHVYNPGTGFLATANNKPVDDAYPHYISSFFDAPYRARRLHEIVAEKGKLTPADAAAVPMDVKSLQAGFVIPRVLAPALEGWTGASDHAREAARLLQDWDLRATADSVPAAIFHVFYERLLREVFEPALGENLFIHFVECWNEHCTTVEAILANPQSAWFSGGDAGGDPPRTGAGRSLIEFVRRSLTTAVSDLEKQFGLPIGGWRWGRLHELTLKHPLHAAAPLRKLLDLGPFPTGGSGTTVCNGQWLGARPFEHMGGAGLRHVFDASDVERSRCVIPGGQSGNPASPHHADQMALWLDGGTIAMPMARAGIEVVSRTEMSPKSP